MVKVTKDEQRVLNYLLSSCMLGGGQSIYNIEECGLDDEYELQKVSRIMQSLRNKGLVSYYRGNKVWYLTMDGKELAKLTFGSD